MADQVNEIVSDQKVASTSKKMEVTYFRPSFLFRVLANLIDILIVVIVFVLVLLFYTDFKVLDYPVDEYNDGDGDGRIPPHAVAAQASDSSTTPDGSSTVQPMDGKSILHDDTGSKEANASDHLRQNTQIVVVHRSSILNGCRDDTFGGEDKDTCSYCHQCINGKPRIAFAQLALQSDDYASY